MFDLEEKVVDHALRQRFPMIGFEAKHDEVAVPSVHLVEAAAGHHVGIGQIEQSGCRQLFRPHVAEFLDAARQCHYLHVALLLSAETSGGAGTSAGM